MAVSPETIAFLKSTPLFARVSAEELESVTQLGEEVTFASGERIIHQDGLTECLYVIVDGRVDIEIEDVSAVGSRGPKSVIGELAMITQTPRNANCTANTEVKAVQFHHKTFWPQVQQNPALAIGLLTEVIYHLDETIDSLYWMSREMREMRASLNKQ